MSDIKLTKSCKKTIKEFGEILKEIHKKYPDLLKDVFTKPKDYKSPLERLFEKNKKG